MPAYAGPATDDFAAAPEDERIAAFEAYDDLAFLGLVHEELVDLILRQRMRAGPLADVHDLGGFRDARRDVVRHERIEGDEIRLRDQFRGAQGEQTGVAGAGADEINLPYVFFDTHKSSSAPWSTSSSNTALITAAASRPLRLARIARVPS
jgi:hypothetical protein